MANFDMIFPTPIYYDTIGGETFDNIQQEMNRAVESIPVWLTPPGWGKTHKLSTRNFQDDQIKGYNLKTFETVLDEHVKEYCRLIGFEPKKYKTTSWFARFDEGDYGHLHNHGDADISGCYYVSTGSSDSNLWFRTPNSMSAASYMFSNLKQSNETYEFKPTTGNIILFPGWLDHGIKTNTSQNTRISFAFNVFFNREG